MPYVNEEECRIVGVCPDEIKRLAKRISSAAKALEKMGCGIFGGSGTGTIRWADCGEKGDIILAGLEGVFDGGDGATHVDEDGVERGEAAPRTF